MKGAIALYCSLFVALFCASSAFAQPACSPPTTNGTCATAATLTVNANCINGTTCAGGVQSASTCLYAGSQCSWYRFTATATSMYVNIDVTATSGCHISSNVYRATGPCTGLTQVSCLSGAPLDDMHPLTGLTIGSLYYIQVCYAPGGPCGNNGSAVFCVEVGIPSPPCSTCTTPCGAAFGYPTAPTIAQVVADCQSARFRPPLQPGTTNTFCNSFVATNTTVSFNVVITSDCGMGNVTNFSWSLYNSPSCGAAIQTGTLASLTFTGLTISNSYVFCYTFTVPANCTHTQHCPYFVGAFTSLPITWLGMDAELVDETWVDVKWATASERNNDHFTVERGADARNFLKVGDLVGAGNSNTITSYRFADRWPLNGVSYYRVKQTDVDGTFTYSSTVSVSKLPPFANAMVLPNPVANDADLIFNSQVDGSVQLILHDAYGRLLRAESRGVTAGSNTVGLGTASLAQGVYVLTLGSLEGRVVLRFVKE